MGEPIFKKTKLNGVETKGKRMRLQKFASQTFSTADPDKLRISPRAFVGKNNGNFFEFYTLDKLLGEGANGKVLLCTSLKDGEQRAVKIMRQSTMSEAETQLFMNETEIMKSLDHPNIIKIYEYFEDGGNFYVIMDLCSGGELFYEITTRQEFTEKDASLLIRQLLSCVSYCHNQNLVHRDLKPENIMLEKSKELDKIKLIDFGQACRFIPKEVLTDKLGTPYYVAPEVLKRSYDFKCDIWSVGVIAFVLLCGYPPFDGNDNAAIFGKIMKGEFKFHKKYWSHVSDAAKAFIRSMLTYDPILRPTANEALRHPWLQNANSTIIFSVPTDSFVGTLENIKKFNAKNELKKATFAYIASQLVTKTERESLAKIFRAYDKNGDGLLSKEEIKSGFENHYFEGIDSDSIEAIFNEVDIDGSGNIDYSEFIMGAMNRNQILSKERLASAFKLFDQDGDGSITWKELKHVLTSATNNIVTIKHVQEIINQADIDGDGCLSVNEFVNMMMDST